MNKKGLKLALTALLAVSQAYALSEWRTPWIASSGPLRYMFEKHDEDQKYALNLWSAYHTKYANRAFTKDSFKTKEITALIFNKSEFNVGDASYNGASDPTGSKYNPLADAKTLDPRVEYNEVGMTMGGEISIPVNNGKGRLGMRASVPMRSIDMERLDSGLDQSEDPKNDFVKANVVNVSVEADGANAGAAILGVPVKAYRMDLVRGLKDANGNLVLAAAPTGVVQIDGQPVGAAIASNDDFRTSLNAAIVQSATGLNVPNTYIVQVRHGDGAGGGVVGGSDATGIYQYANGDGAAPLAAPFVPMVAGGSGPVAVDTVDFFDNTGGNNYAALFTAGSVFDQNKNKQWLVFRRAADSADPEKFSSGAAGGAAGNGGAIARTLDMYIGQYTQNAFAYLTGVGFSLDSQNRVGLGDLDVDFFYGHQLHEDWNAEVLAGIRFPTADSRNKFGSPYRPLLGNGEHFELKLGGLVAWQPLRWMNVKADASYSFALQSKENRMAVFAGSTIKNLGPKAPANVDWSYGKAHLDFTFFHPKTSDIRSTLGYEFYYKTKDNVSYISGTAVPFDGSAAKPLDNKLAAANTESMSHKVRFEASYQLSQYLELFCGGSYTFAGQNVMRDTDTHGGFNVRF